MEKTKTDKTAETSAEPAAAQHTKEQLRDSQRYADRRDIISVLLEDGKTYTTAEVDKLVKSYLKGTVK